MTTTENIQQHKILLLVTRTPLQRKCENHQIQRQIDFLAMAQLCLEDYGYYFDWCDEKDPTMAP